MSQKFILDYGQKLIKNNPYIPKNRKIFYISPELLNKISMTDTINSQIIQQIIKENNLPINDNMSCKIFFKYFSLNTEMLWHQDDASIFKHTNKHCEKYNLSKYNLFSNKVQPIYTMVLFMSDYGEDFYGGEFCFVDLEIKPIKGMSVFFDSREIHCVKKILKGSRQSCLIKFYN
jgi:predicted 2-oxoglutarate/Fe(II)-dependent dioxygenase YbiX